MHACAAQQDTADFKKGDPTGNFMVAITTPKGPVGNMTQHMDAIKLNADTVRLRADFRLQSIASSLLLQRRHCLAAVQ